MRRAIFLVALLSILLLSTPIFAAPSTSVSASSNNVLTGTSVRFDWSASVDLKDDSACTEQKSGWKWGCEWENVCKDRWGYHYGEVCKDRSTYHYGDYCTYRTKYTCENEWYWGWKYSCKDEWHSEYHYTCEKDWPWSSETCKDRWKIHYGNYCTDRWGHHYGEVCKDREVYGCEYEWHTEDHYRCENEWYWGWKYTCEDDFVCRDRWKTWTEEIGRTKSYSAAGSAWVNKPDGNSQYSRGLNWEGSSCYKKSDYCGWWCNYPNDKSLDSWSTTQTLNSAGSYEGGIYLYDNKNGGSSRNIVSVAVKNPSYDVRVFSNEGDASISMDNSYKCATGWVWWDPFAPSSCTISEVSRATHTFSASKDKFESASTSSYIDSNKELTLNIYRNRFQVKVETNVEYASVYVDNQYKCATEKNWCLDFPFIGRVCIFNTPTCVAEDVLKGTRNFKATKTNYHDATSSPYISSDTTVRLDLAPKTYSAVAYADMDGVSIYLDSKNTYKCTTSKEWWQIKYRCTVTGITNGQHTLIASKSGYPDQTRSIDGPPDTSAEFDMAYDISVYTYYNWGINLPLGGVSVSMDDSYKCTTGWFGDCTITNAPWGTHTLKFEKENFKTKETTVTGPPDKSISMLMEPISYSLVAETNVPGASLKLESKSLLFWTDYTYTGATDSVAPYEYTFSNLRAGTHSITASASGFLPSTKSIIIPNTSKVRIDLYPESTISLSLEYGSIKQGECTKATARGFTSGMGGAVDAKLSLDAVSSDYQSFKILSVDAPITAESYSNEFEICTLGSYPAGMYNVKATLTNPKTSEIKSESSTFNLLNIKPTVELRLAEMKYKKCGLDEICETKDVCGYEDSFGARCDPMYPCGPPGTTSLCIGENLRTCTYSCKSERVCNIKFQCDENYKETIDSNTKTIYGGSMVTAYYYIGNVGHHCTGGSCWGKDQNPSFSVDSWLDVTPKVQRHDFADGFANSVTIKDRFTLPDDSNTDAMILKVKDNLDGDENATSFQVKVRPLVKPHADVIKLCHVMPDDEGNCDDPYKIQLRSEQHFCDIWDSMFGCPSYLSNIERIPKNKPVALYFRVFDLDRFGWSQGWVSVELETEPSSLAGQGEILSNGQFINQTTNENGVPMIWIFNSTSTGIKPLTIKVTNLQDKSEYKETLALKFKEFGSEDIPTPFQYWSGELKDIHVEMVKLRNEMEYFSRQIESGTLTEEQEAYANQNLMSTAVIYSILSARDAFVVENGSLDKTSSWLGQVWNALSGLGSFLWSLPGQILDALKTFKEDPFGSLLAIGQWVWDHPLEALGIAALVVLALTGVGLSATAAFGAMAAIDVLSLGVIFSQAVFEGRALTGGDWLGIALIGVGNAGVLLKVARPAIGSSRLFAHADEVARIVKGNAVSRHLSKVMGRFGRNVNVADNAAMGALRADADEIARAAEKSLGSAGKSEVAAVVSRMKTPNAIKSLSSMGDEFLEKMFKWTNKMDDAQKAIAADDLLKLKNAGATNKQLMELMDLPPVRVGLRGEGSMNLNEMKRVLNLKQEILGKSKIYGTKINEIRFQEGDFGAASYDKLYLSNTHEVGEILSRKTISHENGHLLVHQKRFKDVDPKKAMEKYDDYFKRRNEIGESAWLDETEANMLIKVTEGEDAFKIRVKSMVDDIDYPEFVTKASNDKVSIHKAVSIERLARETGDKELISRSKKIIDELNINEENYKKLAEVFDTTINNINSGKIVDVETILGEIRKLNNIVPT